MNAFILSLRDQPFGGAVTAGVLYKAFPYWDVWWNDPESISDMYLRASCAGSVR